MGKLLLATGAAFEISGFVIGITLFTILIVCIISLAFDFDAFKENRKNKKEEKKRFREAMKDKELD